MDTINTVSNKYITESTDTYTELSKIVEPVGQKLIRSDLNFFASDLMSGAIFQ
jgi:hypothetical protein